MPLIFKRIRGSSLPEVVTAIVIISLSIALTGVLFGLFTNSSGRIQKLQAVYLAGEIIDKAVLSENTEDEEIITENFIARKTVISIDEERNLWLFLVDITDLEGDALFSRKQIMEINFLYE